MKQRVSQQLCATASTQTYASSTRSRVFGRHGSGRRGFTLIELIVVLGIISILAALLFPVFAKAREGARRTACASNLRQIGSALTQYIQENDEVLPFSSWGGFDQETEKPSRYKWMDAIYPFVKDEALFVCPSDKDGKYRYLNNLADGDKSNDYGSYGQNGAYNALNDNQRPPRSASGALIFMSMIAQPSATVWATDTNNREEVNHSYGFRWTDANNHPTLRNVDGHRQLDSIVERHNDRVNVLWCDGHSSSVKLEQLAKTKPTYVNGVSGTLPVMTAFTIEND